MHPSLATYIRRQLGRQGPPAAAGSAALELVGVASEAPVARRAAGAPSSSGARAAAKRILDVCGAISGLIVFSPLLLACALLIKVGSPGPVLYAQTRLGRKGRMFRMWKLRTMHCNADQLLEACLRSDASMRLEWTRERKLRHDPRVTWIGHFLRRFSLDELPQFWNVLTGDMSLVGPRPIQYDEMARYARRFAAYCSVRPGLTGLWQVSGRSDTTYEERITLDVIYSRTWSVEFDLMIMAQTFGVVFRGRGAY